MKLNQKTTGSHYFCARLFGARMALLCTICLTIVSCKQAPKNEMSKSTYKVMTVALTDKALSTNYPATMRGKQDVEIRPQVSGTITEIRITEGQTVNKGQVLFIIDQVPYQTALQVAQANTKSAEASVATAQLVADSRQELFNQNVVSAYDLQTAQNTLKVQQANHSLAKAQETNAYNNLSYTVVKSPADGVVGTLPYRVGALVNSSIVTPLTTISDNVEMYIYFSMTENQALSLSGQYGSLNKAVESMPEVELLLNNKNVYKEKGRIESISGIIDPKTGTVSVRAVFPNKERMLLSGGSGNVIFPYQLNDCIVVPQAATYQVQEKVFAYKVVDGVAQSTLISVFPVSNGKEYVVESGLTVGDIIISEGAGLLRNGTPISY